MHDKRSWGDGPWQTEPDRVDWVDRELNYPCLANRGPLGQWCGYVGLRASHPLYGKPVQELEDKLVVHGGVTYAGPCQGEICHDSKETVWWIGFDCAHADDLPPLLLCRFPGDHRWGEYRTLEYVKSEIEYLAAQLVRYEVPK